MTVILALPDLSIETRPDPSIEPGHQWILISNDTRGRGLAAALYPPSTKVPHRAYIVIPHNAEVDDNLKLLFDLMAAIRLSAPGMMQLNLTI